MLINGKTDIGMVRQQNQDAYWFHQSADDRLVAVVCDGMGGARGGQQASAMAVQAVKDSLTVEIPQNLWPTALGEIVKISNKKVYDTAFENSELNGMGTTMVLLAAEKDDIYLANVGDSRGYHITNGGIRQITKDHSAVQELVDSGHITERQAKIHPNKNIITRAIGVEEEVEYDLFQAKVSQGDIIILCSDGLTNHVDENEIQFEASGGDFQSLAQRLINLANSRGGSDNITVVAIQI